MRTRVKITDLSTEQWNRIHERVLTRYEIPYGTPTVCVVFELSPQTERHAEMPVFEFAALVAELAQVIQMIPASPENRARAVLTPDALPDHLEAVRAEDNKNTRPEGADQ